MTNSQISGESLLILIITIFVISFAITAFIVNFLIPFISEKNYLKMEIKRSQGEEKKYYERKLKLFYASHIPLVRRFIYKREEKYIHKRKS